MNKIRKKAEHQVDRRSFLKGTAIAAGAALAATAKIAAAAEAEVKPAGDKAVAQKKLPSETFITHPGSDFMADVLRSVGMNYVAINPAAGFRSLQESIINHLGNQNPEILTCLHEETAAGMAHGYAKASGKPMGMMCHGTVGLQHATMGIYNAWCDRVPLMILAGNGLRADTRRPGVEWTHSVQDPGDLVRDYIKWDDQPMSLQHFAESTVRAWKYATTAPMEPVMVVCDMDIQEDENEHRAKLRIPKMTRVIQPQGDTAALAEAAKLLAAAEKPVIVADRAVRSQEGVKLMVELAEAITAPVIDNGNRMNFPTTHDLSCTFLRQTLLRDADVILLLEVNDPWGTVNSFADPYKTTHRIIKPDARVLSISMREVYLKSNYQDIQRYQPMDLAISGDVEATLPDLIEAIKRATTSERKSAIAERAKAVAKLHRQMRERDKQNAAHGCVGRGTDHGSRQARPGVKARDRGGEARRPRAGRRGLPGALRPALAIYCKKRRLRPGDLQNTIVFASAIMHNAKDTEASRALVHFLRTPEAAAVRRAWNPSLVDDVYVLTRRAHTRGGS